MEEAIKTKEKIKAIFTKKYTWTIVYTIIIILYIISLNLINRFASQILLGYIDIISVSPLIISIIVLEKSYKDKGKNSLFAIEFLILSVYILLMNYLTRIYKIDIQTYLDRGIIYSTIYYIFKTAIIYTKEHQEHLKSLSDIKQIIKEEPIKKETKRKNIKK